MVVSLYELEEPGDGGGSRVPPVATLPGSATLALVLLTVLVLGVACSAEHEDALSDEAAVAIVDLQIQPSGRNGDELFGRLSDVAALSDGTIFTADWQIPEIRRYSKEGEFLGIVGGVGEGPGEYTRLADIEAMPGDRIAAWPTAGRRLVIFDAEGDLDQSFTVPSSLFGQRMLEVDTQGRLYVRDSDRSRLSAASPTESAYVLHRLDPTDGSITTIPMPLEDEEQPMFVLSRPSGMLASFGVETHHAWSPLGYLVHGRNDRYAIEVRAPAGPAVLERDIERVPLEPGERELWLAWADYFKNRPRDAFEVGERPDYTIPEIKPYFREIRVADDGRIWIHRYVRARLLDPSPPAREGTPGLAWMEPSTYDVFEPSGEFLGTVVLPPRTSFSQARGNWLWGIQADELGEHSVVRMRVEPELVGG